jgi:hypothetical protein
VVAVVGVPSGGRDAKRVVYGFMMIGKARSLVVSFRVPCAVWRTLGRNAKWLCGRAPWAPTQCVLLL